MHRTLDRIITEEVGTVYLHDTLEQCIERYKKSGLEYTVENEEDTVRVIIGDYKNLEANLGLIYKDNEAIIIDLCDSTIRQIILTDGTVYSYDEYRELNESNVKAQRFCCINGESIEVEKMLPRCNHKKCSCCKYGATEEYMLTDSELGYKLHYDNTGNDAGMKCLYKM